MALTENAAERFDAAAGDAGVFERPRLLRRGLPEEQDGSRQPGESRGTVATTIERGAMRFPKFIKLTDRTAVCVNPAHVIDLSPVQGGTQITTTAISSNGQSRVIVVREDLDKVVEALEG